MQCSTQQSLADTIVVYSAESMFPMSLSFWCHCSNHKMTVRSKCKHVFLSKCLSAGSLSMKHVAKKCQQFDFCRLVTKESPKFNLFFLHEWVERITILRISTTCKACTALVWVFKTDVNYLLSLGSWACWISRFRDYACICKRMVMACTLPQERFCFAVSEMRVAGRHWHEVGVKPL